MRIGFGFDDHQLDEGRELWLGGVNIPAAKGALGHSDADVLLHAICDAILGALALGDIGKHFPDTDNSFKGIDSKILLREVVTLIQDKGYSVVNIDCTVILETPKLNPHIPDMQAILAEILKVELDAVSLKATTHEKVDSFGEGKAIKAYAVCLLNK
jgi:2-C-methyl-D-erythritol 2,4-cyclodiphosphate synthase